MSKSLQVNQLFAKTWLDTYALAPSRFERFSDTTDVDAIDAMCRYIWNLDLSVNLYRPLHFLEIGLRNSIHQTLTQGFGTEFWFDTPKLLLPEMTIKIANVRKDIQREGKVESADQIVSKLTFGFWTSLTTPYYRESIYFPYSKQIFPNLTPAQRRRKEIANNLNDARKLRNRIFHHEPVWQFHNLTERYNNVMTLTQGLNDSLYSMAQFCCGFNKVQSQGWQTINQHLRSALQRAQERLDDGQFFLTPEY
jgi:hypothetical protein